MAVILSKRLKRRVLIACGLFVCLQTAPTTTQQSALAQDATFSEADVVNAIEKAKILDPSIRLNARLGADEVTIATYKNPKATDNDCKIEAVLIAKTVMELGGGKVPRVTVYFYSATSLSSYKEVTVSAGDVKAFGDGSLSQDQLLASLKITADRVLDPNRRVDNYLQEVSSTRYHKVTSTIKDGVITLSSVRDASMSERNLKYLAFTLAEDAFEAAGPELTRAVVEFYTGGSVKRKESIAFTREQVLVLGKTLSGPLESFPIEVSRVETRVASTAPVVEKIDLQKITPAEGPYKEERLALLDRLKALSDAGVNFGVGPGKDLLEIEKLAAAGDTTGGEDVLRTKIDALDKLLTRFEENLKLAKEHTAGKEKDGAASTTAAPGDTKTTVQMPAPVNEDELKRIVLANPTGYINEMAAGLVRRNLVTGEITGKYKTADEHPNFQKNLQFVIDTLKANNRAAEAVKFEERLNAIRAKAPK